MKVLLQRDMFLGGSRYRRDRFGTEVPDFVDGRKVVFADAKEEGDVVRLPKDAKPFTEPDKPKTGDLVRHTGRPAPKALSQLAPKSKTIDE